MDLPRIELQSGETDDILNTIDGLRQLGVGSILELPQIIVCGDQSSGKSSVLNAVSTIPFPTKDGLCTRFATEVIMRPGETEQIVVSIVPEPERTHAEKTALDGFRRVNVKMDQIESLIDQAAVTMGIDPQNPHARRFSGDILRFEVTGRSQPSLTLVDLPGLFRAGNIHQTKEDIVSVRELVLRYMRNKRSVILAVISAKSDFVLQTVTELSGEVDSNGLRTLGIITKPDKLDIGSDSEKAFVELAENKLKFLHRGWHVLVNRDYSTRTSSQTQRDDYEKEFLSSGVWAKIPANHKGIFTLRTRLSIALRELIIEGLPELLMEAEEEVDRCEETLSRLGASRANAEDRRKYLLQAANLYSVIMHSCVNGSYDDKFFHSRDPEEYKQKRLRAIVQNTLMEYSQNMQQYGHAKHVIDDADPEDGERHPTRVTQAQFEDNVMELMKHSRGRELMTTHNPMLVRDLFQAQSEPWRELTHKFQSRLINAVRTSIELVLSHATDENTRARLGKLVIGPSLDSLLNSLNDMTNQLLALRMESHPITYNRTLAESITKAEQKHAEKLFAAKYERAINQGGQVVSKDTLKWLFEEQIVVQSTDLPRYAASHAIIEMRAYYKIAKDNLVDNFSTLAIERCLIRQLPNLFSPESVADLDDDIISEIAMETESAAWERSQTDTRLELCLAAVEKLKSIGSMRAPARELHRMQYLQSSPGFEVIQNEEALDIQADGSLSKLDVGLSEQENEESQLASVTEQDLATSLPTRGKQKKMRVRDSNWWNAPPEPTPREDTSFENV